MAIGNQAEISNIPAAPALSQGFGGEAVAMNIDISGLALRFSIRYGSTMKRGDDGGERRGEAEKSHVAESGDAEVGVYRNHQLLRRLSICLS